MAFSEAEENVIHSRLFGDGTVTDADLVKLAAVTATAAEINSVDGSTATYKDLNSTKGLPFDYVISHVATGGANICEVTVQAKDANGTNIAHVVPLLIWLSDSAAGAGLTGTGASGAVAAKAGSQDLAVLTAKKALLVQTSATGAYSLSITDTAKTAFVVCVQSLNGELLTTHTLAGADYGA